MGSGACKWFKYYVKQGSGCLFSCYSQAKRHLLNIITHYTMVNYFKPFTDVKELKKQYKQLALKLHPDKGGDEEQFKAMSNQYETLLKKALSGQFYNDSSKAQSEFETDEKMREVLEAIMSIQGIDIDIVGNWIWITGNTFDVKEDLKKSGFKFAKKKTAWYWNDGTYKKKSKKQYDLNQIKDFFGSEKVSNKYSKNVLN